MIVVATEDFELYHDLIAELRQRRIEFTTVEVGDDMPTDADAVITGTGDDLGPLDLPVVRGTAAEARQLVDDAVAAVTAVAGRTIVGVDPGDQPGIAVLRGGRIVSAFQVPVEAAADQIKAEVADDPDAVVRIGDGARLIGARLIDELEAATVELVDETGTTPHLGTGAHGTGDVLAAVNIATRPGRVVDERDVEPTAGELGRIQRASRERSPTNREIPAALAERVASGELSIEEALNRHRDAG